MSRATSDSDMHLFFVRLEEEILSKREEDLRGILSRRCSVKEFPIDAFEIIRQRIKSENDEERFAAERILELLEEATGVSLESVAMDDINGGGSKNPAQFAS